MFACRHVYFRFWEQLRTDETLARGLVDVRPAWAEGMRAHANGHGIWDRCRLWQRNHTGDSTTPCDQVAEQARKPFGTSFRNWFRLECEAVNWHPIRLESDFLTRAEECDFITNPMHARGRLDEYYSLLASAEEVTGLCVRQGALPEWQHTPRGDWCPPGAREGDDGGDQPSNFDHQEDGSTEPSASYSSGAVDWNHLAGIHTGPFHVIMGMLVVFKEVLKAVLMVSSLCVPILRKPHVFKVFQATPVVLPLLCCSPYYCTLVSRASLDPSALGIAMDLMIEDIPIIIVQILVIMYIGPTGVGLASLTTSAVYTLPHLGQFRFALWSMVQQNKSLMTRDMQQSGDTQHGSGETKGTEDEEAPPPPGPAGAQSGPRKETRNGTVATLSDIDDAVKPIAEQLSRLQRDFEHMQERLPGVSASPPISHANAPPT